MNFDSIVSPIVNEAIDSELGLSCTDWKVQSK